MSPCWGSSCFYHNPPLTCPITRNVAPHGRPETENEPYTVERKEYPKVPHTREIHLVFECLPSNQKKGKIPRDRLSSAIFEGQETRCGEYRLRFQFLDP